MASTTAPSFAPSQERGHSLRRASQSVKSDGGAVSCAKSCPNKPAQSLSSVPLPLKGAYLTPGPDSLKYTAYPHSQVKRWTPIW